MSIKQFYNEVKTKGIKIAEYKEKCGIHLAFFGYNCQTYMVDMNQEGKISKETPATWKTMVANMQED